MRTIPIEQINPAPYNPRKDLKPGDPEYERIRRSIEAFGLVEPLVWNERSGVLVGGHQRLKVLADLGYKRVQVSVVDLDEEHEKALNVALNRLEGSWDRTALRTLLGELRDLPVMDLTGFTLDDLRRMGGAVPIGYSDPDDAPAVPAAPYVQRGEVYALGQHRVMCGDSTEPADIDRLMDGSLADLVWTDPPYGVAVASRVGTRARSSAEARAAGGAGIRNDELDVEALTTLLRASLGLALQRTRPGAAWYVTAPHAVIGLAFSVVLAELGVWRHSLVWVKDSLVLGRTDYHYRHEPIYYGWTPGGPHHAVTDRTSDSVWEIPRPKRSAEHPTMKPVELVERAIMNSSDEGALVLDPFVGSGTTIIAAEQTHRRCYAMEIDPKYAQVAIERWQTFTGDTATLVPRARKTRAHA